MAFRSATTWIIGVGLFAGAPAALALGVSIRAIASMLVLIVMAGEARAEYVYALDAPQVLAGQEVNLRFDETDFHCFNSVFPTVFREGNTVSVTFGFTDAIPPGTPGTCPPTWVSPRSVSLGTFAPGNYTVEVTGCSNPTPPAPSCEVQATLNLTVFGSSGARFTVPTLSGAAVIFLAFVVMALGATSPRRP